MRKRRILAVAAVVALTLAAGRASAADLSPGADLPPSKEAGRVLVVAGLVVQGVNLGFTTWAVLQPGGGGMMVTIPAGVTMGCAAPPTIAGFEALLEDGTPQGRARAAAIGCLEGAFFSLLEGVLHFLAPLTYGHQMSICIEAGECWEGSPQVMLFHVPAAASYGAVSIGLFVAGAALHHASLGAGIEAPPTPGASPMPHVAPLALRDGGGAVVGFRW